MEKLLSIIIPAYNAQNYLLDAVSSIDLIDDRIEIIIINDGSKDDTLKVATELKLKYPQIVIVNQSNVGLAQTRNIAISISKGSHIMFLDPDDKYENNLVTKVVNYITNNKIDLIIYDVQDYDINRKKVVKITHHGKLPKNAGSVYWNKVYRKNLFNGMESPKGHLFEDTAVIPAVVAKAKSITVFNDIHYTYTIGRDTSIMTKNWGKNFKDKVFALENLNRLSQQLEVHGQKNVQEYILANAIFTLRYKNNLKSMTKDEIIALCNLGKNSLKLVKIKKSGLSKYVVSLLIIIFGDYYAKNFK